MSGPRKGTGSTTGSPRISVIIPSYQHADFITQAVMSALGSDLPEGPESLEVVVVDDGSTDGSVERLQALDDPRLRLFAQENRGAHHAFNRGLDLAQGELLFFLNSDDIFRPDRIARMVELFDRDPEVVSVASWLRLIDGDGRQIGIKKAWKDLPPWPRPNRGPDLEDLNDPTLALLTTNWVATTSNLAMRRTWKDESPSRAGLSRNLAELRFRSLRYCHDWDFLLRLGRLGKMALIEDTLVDYRVHEHNTIKEGSASDTRDMDGDGSVDNSSASESSMVADPATGPGAMRFEILWLLASHGMAVLRGVEKWADADERRRAGDLRQRFCNGLPHFGALDLVNQLLLLRSDGEVACPAFVDLLQAEHPFRRRWLEILESWEPGS